MDLAELRSHAQEKLDGYQDHLRSLDDSEVQHFSQKAHGPLENITEAIKQEYRSHIETYATLIAQIDSLLGA